MKKNVFKMLVLLGIIAIMQGACGGGDESASPEAANPDAVDYTATGDDPADQTADDPTDNLPEIVDNYYDGIFRYVDQSLYAGSYNVYAEFPDTCSEFFGIEMQDTIAISSVSSSYLNINLNGTHTFYAASQYELGEVDAIGYKGSYHGEACAIVLGSVNDTGRTYDLASIACVNGDLSDDCGIGYYRPSSHDFSRRTIKNSGSLSAASHVDTFMDALQNILEQTN